MLNLLTAAQLSDMHKHGRKRILIYERQIIKLSIIFISETAEKLHPRP